MTIGIVVLHYGDIETTDICVQSILAMETEDNIQVIVIDNDTHKTADERIILKEKYIDESRITVIQINTQSGFSEANNTGYKYAKENLQADFIVMCNNDIEFVQREFVQKLVEIYRKDKYTVLAPAVYRKSTGEPQNPMDSKVRNMQQVNYTIWINRIALKMFSFIAPILLWREEYLQEKNKQRKQLQLEYYQKKQENIVPFGACLVFSVDYLKRFENAFEPETTFFYEEYILAYKCMEKGLKILYDPSVRVLHESGKATRIGYADKRKRLRFQMERIVEACGVYKKFISDNKKIGRTGEYD